MQIERIYEKYISETAHEVVVANKSSTITLQRNRMYNSHLDIHGFLYTDYADKEYQQKNASNPAYRRGVEGPRRKQTDEVISEKAKRGWETRRKNKELRGE